MKDHRRTAAWQRLRSNTLAMARLSSTPVRCWRCEDVIDLDHDHVDLGHVVDMALMTEGDPLRVRLEHRSCNRAAGYALGQESYRPSRESRQYVSRGLR